MKIGKRICKTLKELRKRIADANEIPFETDECTHKGDCPGTCPKCEDEVSCLMDSIEKREQEGKPVVIEGLMTDDELRQAFLIDSTDGMDDDDIINNVSRTAGLPVMGDVPNRTIPAQEEGIVPQPQGDAYTPEIEILGDVRHIYSYDFALIILKELLAETDGNFVFSPAGLCHVLNMLSNGMDVRSDVYRKLYDLAGLFNNGIRTIDSEDFRLEHASSIWYNKTLGAIKEQYIKTLKHSYKAEAKNANFAEEGNTKLLIDEWVSNKTHGMIPQLDTKISQDALMVVLDAIYMNGKWESPFKPYLTEKDMFNNSNGTTSEVDMMYQALDDAEYAETDEYQVITLPYRNSECSMMVVLPKDGVSIDNVMSEPYWIDSQMYLCEDDMLNKVVELYMPRFKFNNTLSFKEILSRLGLADMFDRDDSFPEITDFPAFISQIKQQCVIEVGEEGTKASAVTIAECEVGCPPPDDVPQYITMKLDKPFGFAIKNQGNEILFMGAIKNM